MKDPHRNPFTPLSTETVSNSPTNFFTKLLDISFNNLAEVGTLVKPKAKDSEKDPEHKRFDNGKRTDGEKDKSSKDTKSLESKKRKYSDINTWYRKTLRKWSPRTRKKRFKDVDSNEETEPLKSKMVSLRPVLNYPTVESREASFDESVDISNSALITEDLGAILPSSAERNLPNHREGKRINESSLSEKENTSPELHNPLDITRSQSREPSTFSRKKRRLHSNPSSPALQKRKMQYVKPHKILTCLPPGYDLPHKRRVNKMARLRAHKILTCLPPGC